MKSSLKYHGTQPFSAQSLENRKLTKVSIAFYEMEIAREQSQINVTERRFAKGLETREEADRIVAFFYKKIADIQAIIEIGYHLSNNATDRRHKQVVKDAQK